MKVSMALTLDSLVRALRSEAHGLADQIEAGYRPDIAQPRRRRPTQRPEGEQGMRKDRDDFAGG